MPFITKVFGSPLSWESRHGGCRHWSRLCWPHKNIVLDFHLVIGADIILQFLPITNFRLAHIVVLIQ